MYHQKYTGLGQYTFRCIFNDTRALRVLKVGPVRSWVAKVVHKYHVGYEIKGLWAEIKGNIYQYLYYRIFFLLTCFLI